MRRVLSLCLTIALFVGVIGTSITLRLPLVRATPIIVQFAQTIASNVTSTNVQLTSAPTAGDMLVAFVGAIASGGSSATVTSISGGGVTWTAAGQNAQPGAGKTTAEIWAGPNSSGSGQSVTLTIAANMQYFLVVVAEVSGMATSSYLDAFATLTRSTSSPASGLVTSTNATDVFFGVMSGATGTVTTSGPTNGFSEIADPQTPTAPSFGMFTMYLVTSTAGQNGVTVTIASAAKNWWGVIVAIEQATSTGGTTTTTPSTFQPPTFPMLNMGQ